LRVWMTVPTAVHWLELLGYDWVRATWSAVSVVDTAAPPPSAFLPDGQEAVTVIDVPAVAAGSEVPTAPGTRLLPEGPVTPAAPVGPVEPVAPAGPVGPAGPVAPRAPVAPAVPIGPWRPVAPLRPAAPVAPFAPVG